MTRYKDAGVHNDLKEAASKVLYEAARKTWKNRKGRFGEIYCPMNDFSGLRGIKAAGLPPGTIISLGFDGVGTKIQLAEGINRHDTIAYDLFAMVCDDAIVRGAEPVLIGSILDVKSLRSPQGKYFMKQLNQLAKGYVNAARAARVAVINGEIAELGARVNGYGTFNYNWGAAVLWVANEQRAITGKKIKAGQTIVALREYGFRSNGLSLVRKILRNTFGAEYHLGEGTRCVEEALTPSTIYCAAVCDMFGGAFDEPRANVTGVAHITGGGIPEKLGRVLRPSGLGAVLDTVYDPPSIMQEVQELGDVPMREAYNTWNMGNGMLIITTTPEEVIACAEQHNLEAKVAGKIEAKTNIRLKTYTGKWLNFKCA